MTDLEIADDLATAWTEVIAPVFAGRTHCIEAAKIARAALARLGVAARPMPCGIVVANADAAPLINRHVPVADWPPEAWSVGVDPATGPANPGHWNGHMVLVGDGWVGDYSAAQFSRPPLIDLRAWTAPVPDGWDREPCTFTSTDGFWIGLWPNARLAGWRNSNAWRAAVPSEWLDKLVAATRQEADA